MPTLGGYEMSNKKLCCGLLVVAVLGVIAYYSFKKGGWLRRDGFHSASTCPCGCSNGVCSCGVGCPCQESGPCGYAANGYGFSGSSGPMQT